MGLAWNRKLVIWAAGAALLLVLIFTAAYFRPDPKSAVQPVPGTVIEQRIVRGDSLFPLISSGTAVTISTDKQSLQGLAHDDLITYNDPADKEAPLIKIVKAVPGDRFGFQAAPEKGYHYLLVNGEVVKNSEGKPYLVDEQGYKMLSLYVNDYKGVVPADAYLILGDNPAGSRDSTRFGLVSSYDMDGRVVKVGE